MDNDSKRGFLDRLFPVTSYRSTPVETPTEVISTEPLPGVMPPARRGAAVISERTAMTIPGVSRSVALLSGTVSQIPLDAYKAGAEFNGDLVDKPSEVYSRTEFLALTTSSLATYGNAYWLKTFSVIYPGRVTSMEVLNPELIHVEWRKGRKVYHYAGKEYSSVQIEHLMINPRHAPSSQLVLGVGFIQDNREALQGMLDLARYANNWFTDTGSVPVILKNKGAPFIEGEQDKVAAEFYAARANGGVLVLDSDIDYVPMVLDPEDAQFTAISAKAVADVARMAGIPANLLLTNGGDSITYANVQDNDRTFVKATLMPYFTAIENAFTNVTPNGQKIKFNLDAFLRPSTAERYAALSLATFMTTNEKRALEDLPPITGGDVLATSNPQEEVLNEAA